MQFFRRGERGAIESAAAVTLLSVVLGGGAAAAAVVTVINTSAPDDSVAVQTGPKDIVDPQTLIPYGG
ncbi:MAG: hypothetical protein ABIQ13_10445 [Pedococcus sp.]